MGNRRLGRKRLFSLEKLGQKSGMTAGPGAVDAIGHSTVARDGSEIVTEIYVDLGSSKGALSSTHGAGEIIGADGAAVSHLGQITTAVNGHVTLVEMICVETPTGGKADIDLVSGTAANAGLSGSATGQATILAATGSLVAGASPTAASYDASQLADKYLYLAYGGSSGGDAATAYTGGKLVIRLYGYDVPADV